VSNLTVSELISDYVTVYAKPNLKKWQVTERLLEMHVLPFVDKLRVADLRRGDVADLLDRLQRS
jgi:hypothetical protein